jgi:hypothetical protein
VEIGLGAAAFWISIFGFFIAMGWFKQRADERRQETLLRIIERTGQVDEEQMKMLFPPPPAHRFDPNNLPWLRPPAPGETRSHLRIAGTIMVSVAFGAGFFAYMLSLGAETQRGAALVFFGIAGLMACIGVGLFIAALYFPPALPENRDGSQAQ